ncbi:hypothetical protein JYT59_01730 [Sphingobacteriaceae bacterium AH-315-L07]|nr:hypothetical protein [Sphingobacteriaceae bacterium AH-315-L07]
MQTFKHYIAPALVAFLTGITYFYAYDNTILVEIPWIRYSIVLTINTIGWSYAFAYLKITGGITDIRASTVFFGILVCPLTVILLLPTSGKFDELAINGLTASLMIITMIHCALFYLIQKSHQIKT